MQRDMRPLIAALLVGGCGGGSDSGEPAASVSLSSPMLAAALESGDTAALSMTVTVTGAAAGATFVSIVDPQGVLAGNANIATGPNGVFTAKISVSQKLAAAVHQGTLQLRVCRDAACAQPYRGSPAAIPYRFDVGDVTTQTALARWPGTADWSTFQGNAAHTGFVPVDLDITRFSRRWTWTVPPPYTGLNRPAIAAGRVLVSTLSRFAENALFAIEEHDRSVAWRFDFGSIFAVHGPAANAQKVYVASTGHEDTYLWALNLGDGQLVGKTPFGSQWEALYAPTPEANGVYTNGGTYGGMLRFDPASNALNWFQAGLSQYDMWTPAIDGSHAYAYVGTQSFDDDRSGLYVLNKASGEIAFRIRDPDFAWRGWSIDAAPVIAGGDRVIAINGRAAEPPQNRLIGFNVGTRAIDWSVAGQFATNPAVANDVIYVANANPFALEARSVVTGALLWSWVPDGGVAESAFVGDPVVTNNLVFVSTNLRTYAVDRSRRTPVWVYSRPGNLSLSANGVLYIATAASGTSSDGRIVAINVK